MAIHVVLNNAKLGLAMHVITINFFVIANYSCTEYAYSEV